MLAAVPAGARKGPVISGCRNLLSVFPEAEGAGFLLCTLSELLVHEEGDLLSLCEVGDVVGSGCKLVLDAVREPLPIVFALVVGEGSACCDHIKLGSVLLY